MAPPKQLRVQAIVVIHVLVTLVVAWVVKLDLVLDEGQLVETVGRILRERGVVRAQQSHRLPR